MSVCRRDQCRTQDPDRKIGGHLLLKTAADREYKPSKDTAYQPIHHRKILSYDTPQDVFAPTVPLTVVSHNMSLICCKVLRAKKGYMRGHQH